MIDVNFGELMGEFMEHMGKAFDGENTKLSKEENLAVFKMKTQSLSFTQNGTKGKFNRYTTRQNYLANWTKNNEINILTAEYAKIHNKRVLMEQLKPEFEFALFAKELKHWAYLISWFLKIVTIIIINGFKRNKKISVGKVKFIKI
jgi:hypothetical protein